MDALTQDQQTTGDEIQRLISNYKTDSDIRKTHAYLEAKLTLLNGLWDKFETTDNEIRSTYPGRIDHPYFEKDYYNSVQKIFEQYSAEFQQKIAAIASKKPLQGNPSVDTEDNEGEEGDNKNPNADESTSRLIRRQKAGFDNLRRLIKQLERKPNFEGKSSQYLEHNLNMLKRQWEQLEAGNIDIWEACNDPNAAGYDSNEYIDLEDKAQSLIISITEKLEHRQPSANNLNGSTMQLPKIILPTFDGDYSQWRQFSDLFTQMVHNQPLSGCQKMWYLKANLKGEAGKLIKHLAPSNENYTSAWSMLESRYENMRLLVSSLVTKLISQPKIHVESAAAIKSIHDVTKESLMGLENLNVPTDTWDPMLLQILVGRLDRQTHTLYEQSLEQPRQLQTVEHFLKFLETRFQALEALGHKGRAADEPAKRAETRKAGTFASTAAAQTCPMCNQSYHPLYRCSKFIQLQPMDRLQFLRKTQLCVNCMKPGHQAAKCKLRGCTVCSAKHNSLVHLQTKNQPQSTQATFTNGTDHSLALAAQNVKTRRGYVLLSTVLVHLSAKDNSVIECRAILDSGSQLNLITSRMIKKLGLKGTYDIMNVQGIGDGKRQAQQRVNFQMQSRINGYSTRVEAYVLDQIVPPQPSQSIDITSWPLPQNIALADPKFNQSHRVDLLLGAEHYYQLLSVGQISIGQGLPTLQKTVFGWMLAGRIDNIPADNSVCAVFSTNEQLGQQLEKFWQLEEPAEGKRSLTVAEQKCEEHFIRTVKRSRSGRFIVKLPFVTTSQELGQSQEIALNRFLAIERRLSKNSDLRILYCNFMKEYEELGHMQELDARKIEGPHYFIPHHGVIKPESTTTKLRVVFDASCKTSSNMSLNDILASGPTVQDELFSILLRFRLPRFVYTADIEKMYRQILVDDEDKKFQLILWRDEPTKPIKCYQLNTITYGTTSAPYLATRCLQKLAQEGASKYPAGAEVLARDFYVDDVMAGADSLMTALEQQRQLKELLLEGGFQLRKWCANHPQLVQKIPVKERALQLDFDNFTTEHIKILGLTWIPTADQFIVKTSWSEVHKVSKRSVCSDISRIFDPLGIMSPVVITAKIFLQELWKLKLDWDSSLPMELHTRWLNFRQGFPELNNVTFSRHVFAQHIPKLVQIHVFCDASQKAYGAAVYLRSLTQENQIIVRLLCAKSKVNPIKETTIPRLELCAAKVAVELTDRVKRDLRLTEARTYYWTDSEIVLGWINSDSSSYQTFVANRIGTIQNLSSSEQWRHVSSALNPADMLSRGMSPRKLKNCALWFYGPMFLHGPDSAWPKPYKVEADCPLERKRAAVAAVTTKEDRLPFIHIINHGNSFERLKRITAYVTRFIRLLKQGRSKSNNALNGPLTTTELNDALHLIIRTMQEEQFMDDITHLRKGELTKNSSLNSLAPFLDENKIMRVGGRLERAEIPYESKHPMLLPYGHPFTKLLMNDIHRKNLHVGPQTLLAITRQKFWPIKGKTIARSIVQQCVTCSKAKPTLLSQMMGILPAHRVQPARPFINTGVDFCGPIWTHFKLRGKRPQKSYIAVFCCFATKATHLELVTDLTTQAFIGALKRFMGRRGHCRTLYCDNATNFVGARNQLDELKESIYSDRALEEIRAMCLAKSTDFHLIPPRAPHFGGLWEAAVKSAKHLLIRTIGDASLTYEELETIVIQIEAILNSRPLTSMSSNPNDLSALTPGHFLIGEPLTNNIDPIAEPESRGLLSRWKLVTHLKNEFWKRWTREYLNELQQRHKWKHPQGNIEPGTMVVIKEDNLPALKWSLGRIVNVIKGDDGLARVADVRVANGVIRRPIHKLAPLPIENESVHTELDLQHQANEKTRSRLSEGTRPREPTIDERTTRPSKQPRLQLGHVLTTVLLACLCLPQNLAAPVSITPLKDRIGFHFENLGSASIMSNEWTLIVYYDMETYWKEYQGFVNVTHMLTALCTAISREKSCETTTSQMHMLRKELEGGNQLLHQPRNRRRREALNFIGNIANTLFGVLDSRYATEMAQTIGDMKTNEEYLLQLARNQTTLIDATVNIMRKDQIELETHFENIEQQVNSLVNFTYVVSAEIHQDKLTLLFSSLAIQASLIATNLQRAQNSIIDVLADTHHGHVSPQLITPTQLEQQLFAVRGHLSASLKLPVEPKDVLKLYHLMNVAGRSLEKYIIFKITIPLLALQEFELFRVVPIPILINDTFWAIKRSSPFLMIDLHRETYYPLSEEELQLCLSIQKDDHICKQTHPLYKRGSKISSCELNLINDLPPTPECQLINLGNDSQWIQLHTPNMWIFGVTQNTTLKIVCGPSVTTDTIQGSGIIKLLDDCTIKHQHVIIQGHHTPPTITRASYTATTNFSEITPPDQIIPLVRRVNKFHANTEEITDLKNKITKELTTIHLTKKLQGHEIHQFAIGYISAALALSVAVWLIWKFTPNLCKNEVSKPTPTPRRTGVTDFKINVDQ